MSYASARRVWNGLPADIKIVCWTWDIDFLHLLKKIFKFMKILTPDIALQWPGYHKWHLRQVAQTSAKLTPGQSKPGETKTMQATTPELGPVRFWSPKSSSFSGSDSIVVEEAAKNF